MTKIYLALGSNLGDREKNLAAARDRLRPLRASSIYETEPRDLINQPWFLNQVIEAETDLDPAELLAHIKQIEHDLGRQPTMPKGPRVIDIDILFFGGAIVHSTDLEIPHPRIAERRFVLDPLAEIAPNLRHPVTHETIAEMLSSVLDQPVRRYSR